MCNDLLLLICSFSREWLSLYIWFPSTVQVSSAAKLSKTKTTCTNIQRDIHIKLIDKWNPSRL